jgi:hypothetical protein
MEIVEKIATKEGVDKEKLIVLSLITYLTEKKRKYMEERLKILKRYCVNSMKELEEKIRKGEIEEYPGMCPLKGVSFKYRIYKFFAQSRHVRIPLGKT